MTRIFPYGETEVAYLKSRDKHLAAAIDAVDAYLCHIDRQMDDGDLFAAVVHHIVGQQISSAAQATVWARVQDTFGEVTPERLHAALPEELQACGLSWRKVDYIKGFAAKVAGGDFDVNAVALMSDEEAIAALSNLPGIGRWTAEMLLLFCLGRPDILSYGDLAIQRGMRMVYHHRRITSELFERYRRRYSPYGSVASLYLWAISHMDVPGYDRDFAPKAKVKPKTKRG